MVIYAVTSLDSIKSELLRDGNLFALPNGNIYQFGRSDELGGIGSFFKKLGIVALGAAGAIAAPFTGGLSVAAAATLTSAIGAAGAVAGGLLQSTGGGSGGGVAKGLAGINAFGGQVIDALNKIKANAANLAPGEAAKAADELVALLSDSSKVYQAKKGKDAEALQNFKRQAADIATQIKAIQAAVQTNNNPSALVPGGQTPGQTQLQQLPNGQIVAVQPALENSILGGVSNSTLLVGVGIVGLILFLKR